MKDATIIELSASLKAKRFSCVELTQVLMARIDALNPVLNAFITVDPERAQADAKDRRCDHRRGQGRAAHRHSHRAQGHPGDRRDAHDVRLAHARELRVAVRRARGRPPGPRRHRARRQDQHGRVRHGLVERDVVLRSGEESLAHGLCARRQFRRHGGGRRGAAGAGRHGHRHRRLDPPAGRHVGHLRPEAHVWGVLPLRTRRVRVQPRPGRSLRAYRTRPRAVAERDGGPRQPRLDLARPPCRGLRADPRGATRSKTSGRRPDRPSRRIFRCGHRCRRRAIDRQRARGVAQPGGGHGRPRAAERGPVDSGVLRDRPGGGVVEPVALRWCPLRPSGRRLHRPRRHVQEDARRGLRRRSEAPDPGGHLRAVARLLRRVLPQGAAGAQAHRRRLSPRLCAVRRDRRPDGADGCVSDRREERRSRRDVSQRHLHDRREPHRIARAVDPVRLRPQRTADRPAAPGSRVRGSPVARRRASVSSRRRTGIKGPPRSLQLRARCPPRGRSERLGTALRRSRARSWEAAR